MNGLDYVQWLGFYEVAKMFYSEFIPEAEALMPGVTAETMNSDAHKWIKGLSAEERERIREFYQKRYEESPR